MEHHTAAQRRVLREHRRCGVDDGLLGRRFGRVELPDIDLRQRPVLRSVRRRRERGRFQEGVDK